ncbi:hypothetical protein ABTY98_38610 [Streptomyces sp. NPDC096040]|uniref:hypothetical protein n=1 Tax=Streptomyces sp. NPDC096040 TaxID=3155541 RepID=UPI00332127F1
MTSQNWNGHWHAFGPWIGSGDTHRQEGRRRPGEGPQDPQTRTFLEEMLPPMMTGQWLMRGKQVAATWSRAEDAVAWLQARYTETPPMVREDGKAAYCSLEFRVEYALDVLPRGVDIVWGYWTQSRMLASYAVVSCPNLFHPTLPCPFPPNVTSLDSRRRGNVPSTLAPA